MPKFHVLTVLVGVNRGGKQGALYKGDLIYLGAIPTLVIEWSGERGDSDPSVTVALDPKKLQRGLEAFGADYLYQLPVEDPRKFQ